MGEADRAAHEPKRSLRIDPHHLAALRGHDVEHLMDLLRRNILPMPRFFQSRHAKVNQIGSENDAAGHTPNCMNARLPCFARVRARVHHSTSNPSDVSQFLASDSASRWRYRYHSSRIPASIITFFARP